MSLPEKSPTATGSRANWSGRKHATFADADEYEAEQNASRSPEDNVRLVRGLQDRLGRASAGLREAVRAGTLEVRKYNWLAKS